MKKITLTMLALVIACFTWQTNAQTFVGAGNPQPIPVTGTGGAPCVGGPTTSAASVGTAGVVGVNPGEYAIDNVSINLTHTFDADLDITLISPLGTMLDLSSDNGGSGDNYTNTVFMDGAPVITTGAPPYTGTFQAEGGTFAATFAGESINGNWTLSICDDVGGDSGTLLSYSITFEEQGVISVCGTGNPQPIPVTGTGGAPCVGGPTTSPANVPDAGVIGAGGGQYTLDNVTLNLTHTFDADLDITLISPMGTMLDLSSDNGGSGDNYTNTVFMDGAPVITTGAPPYTGTFQAEGGTFAAAFAGESITGNWTLSICDDVGGDSGTLLSYCITLNQNPGPIGAPPVISCPADQMISTTGGQCTGVANWANAIAIDPEDGVIPTTQTMGPPSGSAFPTGVTIIEYSATDSDGNTSTCQFTITVTDNEDPIAVCQDLTVELDASGMFTITPNDLDNGSSDNCGIVSYDFGFITEIDSSSDSPALAIVDNTTVSTTMSVTDNFVITDLDVDLDITHTWVGDMQITLESPAGTQVLIFDGGADGCSGDNIMDRYDDESANVLTCMAGTGNAFPLANYMPSNPLTAFDGESTVGDWIIYIQDTAGGDAGTLNTWTLNYTHGTPFSGTFDCSNVGTNNILLTVTDAQGNSSSCTSVVTVEDNIAPEIVCIGEQVVGPNTASNAPGTSILDNTTVSTTINVAEDFVMTDLNVDLNITHTWVGDLQITLESPAGTQVLIFDGANDGCSGDNIIDLYDDESANPLSCVPASGDAFPLADYIPSNALSAFDGESSLGVWTLFVEDTAGGDQGTINSWSLIYDFAPIVATPLDVVLDANGMATINASALIMSITEACGYTATVDGPPLPMNLSTTLAGGNGNFGNMFDVNALSDISIDSFDVHGEDGVTFDVEVWAKTGTWVGSENTPGDWTLIGSAPGVVSNGTGVVTPLGLSLGYVMNAGETHAFYVTPIDPASGGFQYTNGTTVGAVFASDANIEFLEGAGNAYPFGTTFQPRIFNGNIVYTTGTTSSTTIDFDCSMLGLNQIEVTVTDDSGNVATCTATVNVIDDTDPILICMDVTIELGPDGTAVVDPMALLAVSPSTYEVITISSDNGSGTPGNTDFTAPVTDAAAITFDWAYSTQDGPGFDSFGYLLNGAYTELTNPGGANNQTGSAAVAVNPGDVFGFRSASVDGVFGPCTTVVSNFVPGFSGQFDPANWTLTLNNSDGTAYFVEIPGGPLSYDACGITILAVDVTEVTCADIGTPIVITVFASDASGNIAACTSTVTVVDMLAPVVVCPADITVDPGPGNLFYEVPDYFATGEATATDNCTDPLTILSQSPAAGTLLPDGVYPVTMTAEDESGNVGTCTFTLTVESVLGVDDNKLDVAIIMYPNPAKYQVTISNSSNIQLEKATIYDLNGKLVSQTNLSTMVGEKTIDVSQLAAGVYVVQISSDNASAYKRLIKE